MTHLANKPITTPDQLSHKNYPYPLINYDEVYIRKWNELIEENQMKRLNLDLDTINKEIQILDNDLRIYKDILNNNMTNVDEFFDEINLKKKLNKNVYRSH